MYQLFLTIDMLRLLEIGIFARNTPILFFFSILQMLIVERFFAFASC